MILTIDGVSYDVKCELTRTMEVKSSAISGDLLDGSYFNDVDGTYLRYDIAFTYPLWDKNKYAAIIEALTEPVDGHLFVLPYNNSTVQITARVEPITDNREELESGRTYWAELAFAIIANHPTKTMSLSQVLTRGRAPLPDVANPAQGTSYTWDGTKWVEAVTYEDADNISF